MKVSTAGIDFATASLFLSPTAVHPYYYLPPKKRHHHHATPTHRGFSPDTRPSHSGGRSAGQAATRASQSEMQGSGALWKNKVREEVGRYHTQGRSFLLSSLQSFFFLFSFFLALSLLILWGIRLGGMADSFALSCRPRNAWGRRQ